MADHHYLVEVGMKKSAYKSKYAFQGDQISLATRYFRSINSHSGGKKRLVLVNSDGTRVVLQRVLTD